MVAVAVVEVVGATSVEVATAEAAAHAAALAIAKQMASALDVMSKSSLGQLGAKLVAHERPDLIDGLLASHSATNLWIEVLA